MYRRCRNHLILYFLYILALFHMASKKRISQRGGKPSDIDGKKSLEEEIVLFLQLLKLPVLLEDLKSFVESLESFRLFL